MSAVAPVIGRGLTRLGPTIRNIFRQAPRLTPIGTPLIRTGTSFTQRSGQAASRGLRGLSRSNISRDIAITSAGTAGTVGLLSLTEGGQKLAQQGENIATAGAKSAEEVAKASKQFADVLQDFTVFLRENGPLVLIGFILLIILLLVK